jgi:predicted permease
MIQLSQTLRGLRNSSGFTLTTVLTLAVAIGATTTIFSVVNAVLIKPLPFAESDRLVALTHRTQSTGAARLPASPAIYFTYRDNAAAFESVALWAAGTASVTGTGEPEEVAQLTTTHEFLRTLRVDPALGRSFTAADDAPGSPKTVILSHSYWERQYGAAEDVLGRSLIVDGIPHAVVGVLPQDFRFLQRAAQIVVPMQPDRALSPVGPLGANGIARLKPAVTLSAANADVERMIPILIDTFPAMPGMDMRVLTNQRLQADLQPLKAMFVGSLDDVLWVLMGTIALLLLIACVNVANLQLVRTEGRSRELAIRAALGAGWQAIARSLLLESTLLGLAGGILGLGLAAAALPALLALAAPNLPSVLRVAIDWRVVGFTLAISLAASVLFGLVPIATLAGPQVAKMLGSGSRSHTVSRERFRTRNGLVIAQVAIALVLLVASGLMIRTYEALRDVEPGFTEPEHILALRISIPQALEPDFARIMRIQNDIQNRLASIAGVDSAGFISSLPLDGGVPQAGLFLEDKVLAEGQGPKPRQFSYASPGFFATFGTPLLAGRAFEWADNYEGRQVALVSANVARAEWGSAEAALGKRVRWLPDTPWLEIVGVVGDIHQLGLDRPAAETFYMAQSATLARFMTRTVSYVVRSDRVGSPGFLEEVQAAIWSVNGSLPLAAVQSMSDVQQRSLARTSLTLLLLSITAAMALLLGVLGVYGVISYMLTRRTRELGLRIALGAQNAQLKLMLMRQVLLLVASGGVVGLGAAALSTRLMQSILFGVTALDPATYAAVAATLLVTAGVAGYLPARRVARIEPMQALREE